MHLRHAWLAGAFAVATTGVVIGSHAEGGKKAGLGTAFEQRSTVAGGLVLVGARDATLALVADEEDRVLRVFDTVSLKETSQTRLDGTPGQLLVTRRGMVLVTLRNRGRIQVFESNGDANGTLVSRGAIETGGEPIGLATTPDEARLLVTSGWSHELLVFDLASRALSYRVDLPREPRAVVASHDGKKAYVSHAIGGRFSTIDLSAQTAAFVSFVENATSPQRAGAPSPRPRWLVATQGHALALVDDRVIAPDIFVEPIGAATYYGTGLDSLSFHTIDEGQVDPVTVRIPFRWQHPDSARTEECLLPRAVAVRAKTKTMLLACAGSQELFEHRTEADSKNVLVRRIPVADWPDAVAVDAARDVAVSWSSFGRKLSVTWLGTSTPTATVAASGGSMPAGAREGRRLFHDGVGRRIAFDQRSCATCHAEGRDDGLVWTTPEGSRQTPMLAGRLVGTAPYGWTRDAHTVQDYTKETIRRLGGSGLSDKELDRIADYVRWLRAPSVALTSTSTETRGKMLFQSASVGCSGCHSGAMTTDGQKHQLGTEREAFSTPSLRFVGSTAPYFHDGRYGSLRDLLDATNGVMGGQLSPDDRAALEAYLRTL